MAFVRVKDNTTGHHYTIAETAVDDKAHTVIDKPAVDDWGRPLPPKPSLNATPVSDLSDAEPSTDAAEVEPETQHTTDPTHIPA